MEEKKKQIWVIIDKAGLMFYVDISSFGRDDDQIIIRLGEMIKTDGLLKCELADGGTLLIRLSEVKAIKKVSDEEWERAERVQKAKKALDLLKLEKQEEELAKASATLTRVTPLIPSKKN
jgi:hypothetical protein